jgi:hypothetical protein
MRQLNLNHLLWLSIALLLLPATAFAQETEVRVKLKSVPAPVRQAIREQSQGATIRGVSKETKDGKTFYEVELKVGGHGKDVLFDPTGAVVEVEEEVSLSELPAAVKAEFEKQAGKGRIVKVESVTKKGSIAFYEAKIRKGLKTSEVKVSPEGSLLPEEK